MAYNAASGKGRRSAAFRFIVSSIVLRLPKWKRFRFECSMTRGGEAVTRRAHNPQIAWCNSSPRNQWRKYTLLRSSARSILSTGSSGRNTSAD